MSEHQSPALVGLRRDIATPQTIAVRQVMADGIIAYAAKAKDWPLLHEAVDQKIADQREFGAWWQANVSIRLNHGDNQWLSQERGTTMPMAEAERQSGITNQQVSRWRKWLEDAIAYHDKLVLAAYRKAGLEPEENHRAEGTGDNEWFTPPEYIAAAREVMGGIDLDPASHEKAQEVVRAGSIYTRHDNGLKQPWHGRVWLNPPYAPPLIGQFVGKLVGEFAANRVQQAILLTHNYTDTAWFHEAASAGPRLCFTRGRIRFVDIDGAPCSPTQGQCFFYFGDYGGRFREVFGAFGFVR